MTNVAILDVSVESLAIAPSCLSCLIIITSSLSPLMTPFTLSQSILTFSKLESRLSLDNQLIPEKGPKEFSLFFNKLGENKLLKIFKSEKGPKEFSSSFNKLDENKLLKIFICATGISNRKFLRMSWHGKYKDYGKKYNNSFTRNSLNRYDNYKNYVRRIFCFLDSSQTIKNVRRLMLLCSGDIESNPGPEMLTLTTQNCRGLKNKDKLKQLLCRCNKDKSTNTQIIALQETHLDSAFIKYSWYGNFAITPSVGSKGGVITLVSSNINILEQFDIDNEAQILLTEILDNTESLTLIIVNLHSPCAHDHAKMCFFNKIKEQINELTAMHDNCEIIVLGDFNTTFAPLERINTTRSKNEINIAERITDFLAVEVSD